MRFVRTCIVPRASLAVALMVTGCAPTLSSFRPAHVGPKGEVQVEAGMDVAIPTGTIAKSLDAGRTLARAADNRALTAQEQQQLIEAGAALASNPPSVVEHLGVAASVGHGFEVGLRYAAGAWRLGGRKQLLAQERTGVDMTVGLGVERFALGLPGTDLLNDVVKLDDYVRWTVDLPLVFGTHGSWYRFWGGPRLAAAKFSTGVTLTLPAQGAGGSKVIASAEGTGYYVGGQIGVAIGYRVLFLAVELTAARLLSRADIVAPERTTDADLGGFVLYPGAALMAEF